MIHKLLMRNEIFAGNYDIKRIAGYVMAFMSGLFFTVNNFIIKAAKLSFGDVLAVRSILQVPLMYCIIARGGNGLNN